MDAVDKKFFWAQKPEVWFRYFHSGVAGLSAQEFNRQKGKHFKHKTALLFGPDLKLLLRQFNNPFMLLLLTAVILSALLGSYSDVFIILLVILMAGFLGFYRERSAGKILEKLKKLVAITSTVLREGKITELSPEHLMPGDLIIFNAGDLVPADCLIIQSTDLHVNEASLTGESFPVYKKPGIIPAEAGIKQRRNTLWNGTNIISGTAQAIVINTPEESLFGKVTQAAQDVDLTAFEKGLASFGYLLLRITFVLALVILATNLLNREDVVSSILFTLALAVGMAPELLPAITTMAMSSGAKKLLEKKVMVKRLTSIQNLGEVNLLCTDKTGTITEGVIQIKEVINAQGEPDKFVRDLAYWNAFYESGYTNPIDEALKKLKIAVKRHPEKVSEIPFDFIRKRLSISVKLGDTSRLISKGAFRQMLSICNRVRLKGGQVAGITPYKKQITRAYTTFAMQGYRVIVVAYKNILPKNELLKKDEKDMIFGGFVLINDPIKDGVVQTIQALKKQKVDLKIITGDNKYVALSIGKQLGIKDPKVVTGEELAHVSPDALEHLVNEVHIFSEVEPLQKERIVRALKRRFTVAYLGDGINDVAAMRVADVSFSVQNAVDVAKEAADFVLLDKKLSVVNAAIQEGRKTFINTLKYIYISTGSTLGNMVSVAVASVILPFLPMLPKQILLTNFITDFPYLAIASDQVDGEQIKKPARWDLQIIKRYMLVFGIHSALFDLTTFGIFYYVMQVSSGVFQTAWFIESILTELSILFVIRTRRAFYKSKTSRQIMLLSLGGFVITLALPYLPQLQEIGLMPLPIHLLLLIAGIVILYVFTADGLKIWFFRSYQQSQGGHE